MTNYLPTYHRGDPDRKQQKVLTDRIAGEVVQRNSEGNMPVHVDRDPYHVTNKKVKVIGPGAATKGNRVTPGDTVGRTLTKPTKSVSCAWCSFEITCWMMELARKIVGNHQCRRHPRDDGNMEQGTYTLKN